jgi:hypothetical protein
MLGAENTPAINAEATNAVVIPKRMAFSFTVRIDDFRRRQPVERHR